MCARWLATVAVSLLLIQPIAGADADTARAALDAADKALGKAWQARDLEGLMAHYAPDALASWTGSPAMGVAEVRRMWTQRWADPKFRIVHGVRSGYLLGNAGDMALMHGTSSYVWTQEGEVREVSGNWAVVWQLRAEGWRIVYEVYNEVEASPKASQEG